jgi:hypothetical protein
MCCGCETYIYINLPCTTNSRLSVLDVNIMLLATDNNTHFVENVGEARNLLLVVFAKCGHVVIPVTYCRD